MAAAIALIDEEGLESFSLRRLATRLNAGPMTLYWHVQNKDRLLDLVLDTLIGEVPPPAPQGPWTERVATVIRDIRAAYIRHHRAVPILATRPAVGPNALRLTEALLAVLREAGFPPAAIPTAYQSLLNYAAGSVLAECLPVSEPPEISPEAHPTLAGLSPQFAAVTPDDTFEYGLQRLLAGLAQDVEPTAC